jgi:CDP-4-dehydro-6-deoxyglucose reductase
VQRIERLADDVAALFLTLPANERLQFMAGQYLEIILRDGKRRAYSMANPPEEDTLIELHVRNMGGAFTEYVFNKMKEKDILRFEGPLGTFFLREDSDKPMVLVASGTGFAPIKAISEHIFAEGINREGSGKALRPVALYWGARSRQDLYLDALPTRWASEQPNFRYVPVLSEAKAEDAWTGRTGLVHRAVMEDFPDLSGHQVYACGVPLMVDAARRDFTTLCGLPEDQFFADAFTSQADLLQA